MRSILEFGGLVSAGLSALALLYLGLQKGRGVLARLGGLLSCVGLMAAAQALPKGSFPVLYPLLSSLGALLWFALAPGLCHSLVGLSMRPAFAWGYGTAFGAALVLALDSKSMPGLGSLRAGLLFLEIAWCLGLVASRYKGHVDPLSRRFLRRFFLLTLVFLPPMAIDSLGSTLGWSWIRPFDNLTLPAWLLVTGLLILLEISRWTRPLQAPKDLDKNAEVHAPAGAQPENPWSRLSPRETSIARLVLEGASSKEIGANLGISPRTVENHLYKVFGKLGARSRLQLYHLLGPKGPAE